MPFDFISSLGENSNYNPLLFSSILFGCAAIISGSLRLITIWFSGRLASSIGSDLSCLVYKHTLYQPYEFHLQHSSSEIVAIATLRVKKTVSSISSVFQIMTGIVVSVSLFLSLIFINFQLTIFSLIFFTLTYIGIAVLTKKRIMNNGSRVVVASNYLIKTIQESLGGIRDIILTNTQHSYIETYSRYDRPQRMLLAINYF